MDWVLGHGSKTYLGTISNIYHMQDFCFNPSNRNYTLKHTAVVILFRKYMQQNERQLLLYQYKIMLINGYK